MIKIPYSKKIVFGENLVVCFRVFLSKWTSRLYIFGVTTATTEIPAYPPKLQIFGRPGPHSSALHTWSGSVFLEKKLSCT